MVIFQQPLSIYYSILAVGFTVFVIFSSRFVYNYRRDLFHIHGLKYDITSPRMWYRGRTGLMTATIFVLSFVLFLTPGTPVIGNFGLQSTVSTPLIATKAILLTIILVLVSFMLLSIINEKKHKKKR
ncbi:hypothetical protein ACFLQN_03625 [Candidatus Aenigmatarchaeota archaeon]